MRRFATVLGGLAFLWTTAATAYLLTASTGAGIASSVILAANGVDGAHVLPPLATPTGLWITALLVIVTLVTSVPLGVSLRYPADQRATAWTTGTFLLGFSILAGPSLGLPYLPAAVLLMAAAAGGELESAPRTMETSRS